MAKRVTSIGGQALLEGILMVGPKKNVAAFCDEAGNITTEEVSHGDDRIHHLVSEFLFEPLFKFRGLFLFLAAHFIRRKRQRLHTEA